MTLNLHTLRVANAERQKRYSGSGKLDASFRGLELGGEVGEAQNIVKKLERERLGLAGTRAIVEQLAEELADVIICVDLLAAHYDIDLSDAVIKKFNVTSSKLGIVVYL